MEYEKINDIIQKVLSKIFLIPNCVTKADLKQAAWVEIIENIHKFDKEKGRFYTFIYIVSRNAIIRFLSRNSDYTWRTFQESIKGEIDYFNFNRMYDVVDYSEWDENIEQFERQDESVDLREKINIAKQRIKKVSDLHLKAFELHFEKGYKVKEISKLLNIDYKTSKGYCRYSQILFRKEYKKLTS